MKVRDKEYQHAYIITLAADLEKNDNAMYGENIKGLSNQPNTFSTACLGFKKNYNCNLRYKIKV